MGTMRCCDKSSRLVNHSMDFDHRPKWEDSAVIYKGVPNWGERTFLEGMVSLREENTINIHREIPREYLSLLR